MYCLMYYYTDDTCIFITSQIAALSDLFNVLCLLESIFFTQCLCNLHMDTCIPCIYAFLENALYIGIVFHTSFNFIIVIFNTEYAT